MEAEMKYVLEMVGLLFLPCFLPALILIILGVVMYFHPEKFNTKAPSSTDDTNACDDEWHYKERKRLDAVDQIYEDILERRKR